MVVLHLPSLKFLVAQRVPRPARGNTLSLLTAFLLDLPLLSNLLLTCKRTAIRVGGGVHHFPPPS